MSAIGFIGIGIMGKGMLKNLATKLDATFVIWNRSDFASVGTFVSRKIVCVIYVYNAYETILLPTETNLYAKKSLISSQTG